MKILILSPYLPARGPCACARKVFDSIKVLKEKGHSIYLISFCSREDAKRASEVSLYCAYLHCQYLKDYRRYPLDTGPLKRLIRFVCVKQGIDILQCENSYLSRYIPEDIKTPSILVEHEILSVSFSERMRFERNIFRKLVLFLRAHKKKGEEKNWYRDFKKIIVFTKEDREALQSSYGLFNVEVIPLGVGLQDYPALSASEKDYDLIFVGNFRHSPNTDAVLYFLREAMPLLEKNNQGISLVIAGANPNKRIIDLARKSGRVMVTGYVREVLPYYSKARVFIAPIRFGRGLRFKVLEAMAMGLPVVSTAVGARGIPKGSILIADTPEEFCEQINKLLGDSSLRRSLSEKTRRAVEEHFQLKAALEKYENTYTYLLKGMHCR